MRDSNGRFVKGNFKDRTGEKYGMLTFECIDHVHTSPKGLRIPYWKMKCECGGVRIGNAHDVISGHTKSCGCLHKEATSKARKRHGEADTRLYYTWENMKKRCYNKKVSNYERYGGRGIKICYEWLEDYKNFSNWAHSNGYSDELTIERIDYDGDYKPSNCKWITHAEQAKNRRSNVYVEIEGKRYTPEELSVKHNIPIKTLYARISRGDKGESVVRPLGTRQFYKR